jgi:hypothetical protein
MKFLALNILIVLLLTTFFVGNNLCEKFEGCCQSEVFSTADLSKNTNDACDKTCQNCDCNNGFQAVLKSSFSVVFFERATIFSQANFFNNYSLSTSKYRPPISL